MPRKHRNFLISTLLFILPVLSHGQEKPRKADFYLHQIKVSGLSFHAPLKKVREVWGKEDSSSDAVRHDEMGCYVRKVGNSLIPATFYFFPGLLYLRYAGDSVTFQSLDFTNPKTQKAVIALPKIKVTSKTTVKEILAAYPMAERIDEPKENEVALIINTKDTVEDMGLVFRFYKGKLVEVFCSYDCA